VQTLATILSLAEFESKCLFYESARRGRANDVSHIEFRLRTWWSDCFAPRHPQSVCFLMTIPKKPLNLLCLDFLGVAESGDESISEDESRLETAHLAEVRVPPAPSVSTDTEKEAASVSANEAAPLPTATSSSPMEPAPAAEPAINGTSEPAPDIALESERTTADEALEDVQPSPTSDEERLLVAKESAAAAETQVEHAVEADNKPVETENEMGKGEMVEHAPRTELESVTSLGAGVNDKATSPLERKETPALDQSAPPNRMSEETQRMEAANQVATVAEANAKSSPPTSSSETNSKPEPTERDAESVAKATPPSTSTEPEPKVESTEKEDTLSIANAIE